MANILLRQKMYAGRVNQHAAFDAAPARILHPFPVFKRIGNQCISGNSSDGFVPVLHFHSGQADINHVTVGTILRHFQPIANAEHLIGRELNSSHQPEDRVFEHQHDDRGKSTDPTQQNERRFTHQNRCGQQRRNHKENDLQTLHNAAHGHVAAKRRA